MGRESNAAELLIELAHLVLVLPAIHRDRMTPRNLAALLVNETAARTRTPVMAGSVGMVARRWRWLTSGLRVRWSGGGRTS